MTETCVRVAAAQIRPVWLDRPATAARVIATIEEAARRGVSILAFPEAFLAGYPFWLCRTNGAAFDDPVQKRAFARFLDAAVELTAPELRRITEAARDLRIAVWLGINERGTGAERYSVYCTLLTILPEEGLVGAHRKLVPTYDEKLCWAFGDARDLRVHQVGRLRVGGLNCWENLMPLARFALYAGGEDLHISVWPGNPSVSDDPAHLVAVEGRVWSLNANGLLRLDDVPDDFDLKPTLRDAGYDRIFEGGSSIRAPGGVIVAGPLIGTEGLVVHDIDLALVRAERQALDVAGHYHRADLFSVSIDRRRRAPLRDLPCTDPSV